MRINSINQTQILSSVNFRKQTPLKQGIFVPLSEDVFEKTSKSLNEDVPFGVDKSLLKKPKIFLKPKVAKYEQNIINAAKYTAELTKIFKKALDDEYGKNNYVFISLGTSPALIGKGLELMGQDVRYVPISNTRHVDLEELSPDIVKEKMGKDYINFLDSIGLNKDKVNSDKRKYILCDYTASGRSLSLADYVANNVLGIKRDKIEPLSLNVFLSEYVESNGNDEQIYLLDDYTDRYLANQDAAKYSDVPHLDYRELPKFDLDVLKIMGMKEDSQKFDEALRYYL